MKPESRSTVFRRLAEQLRSSCASHGLNLNEGGAELILADRINEVAKLIRVTDRDAMHTYFHADAMDEFADVCVRAREQQDIEVELASPMVLPINHAATVIGSLAASCQAASTAPKRTQTTAAIMEATAAIVAIAGAIARAGESGAAILDAETAVIARGQLAATIAHLRDGRWQMPGHRGMPDAHEHDRAMAERIQSDRDLLRDGPGEGGG
jgi:hypothetical protein